MVIHSQNFPGWELLSAFSAHLSFIRNYHQQIARVALVSDSKLASLTDNIANHFVSAQIECFDFDGVDKILMMLIKPRVDGRA